jgi:Lon protease-like protein
LSTLLPLFPLDLVLFPGANLPLHIFEPRYREMIAECLERSQPFGVVRGKDQELAEIGCTAVVLDVAKKYPDGRMDIVSQGRDRFEVMQLNQVRSFLQAEVLYLRDEPGVASKTEITHALELSGEIMSLAGAEPEQTSTVDEQQLSFHLAAPLPIDLDFKQSLLGMKSEAERLRALITLFETVLPGMRRAVYVRGKAGGNGHAG